MTDLGSAPMNDLAVRRPIPDGPAGGRAIAARGVPWGLEPAGGITHRAAPDRGLLGE